MFINTIQLLPEAVIFLCSERGVPLTWRKPQKVSGNVIKVCETYLWRNLIFSKVAKLTPSQVFLACNFKKSDLFQKCISKFLFIFSKHLFKILENTYQRLLMRFVKLASIDCLVICNSSWITKADILRLWTTALGSCY